MRIATWNINSLSVRLPQLIDWLDANPVDVIALQETKLVDERFPHDELRSAGYHAICFGQPTYNGVAILSRLEAASPLHNIPGFDDPQARVLTATVRGLRIVNAYFPNGQTPDSPKFTYKLAWIDALHRFVMDQLVDHAELVLLGDYNIAPEDRDVHDPVAWAGQVHCTEQEREKFRAFIDMGLCDAFRLFDQAPKSWSWWDYRNLAFRRNQGLRIDHVLVSPALRPRVVGCTIDKLPRKNERPSDHAPVVLELAD